jgi:proprotein convertase subtilisin/kexin type 5
LNNQCQASCPVDYVPDSFDQLCKHYTCHSSCLTCNGPTSSDCLTCNDQTYLYAKKCLATCPTKTYSRTVDRTCQDCDVYCADCQSPGNICNSCISEIFKNLTSCFKTCPSPFWGNTQSSTWKCENSCGRGFYPNLNNRTCLKCNETCETCASGSDTGCQSCRTGFFLTTEGKCSGLDLK